VLSLISNRQRLPLGSGQAAADRRARASGASYESWPCASSCVIVRCSAPTTTDAVALMRRASGWQTEPDTCRRDPSALRSTYQPCGGVGSTRSNAGRPLGSGTRSCCDARGIVAGRSCSRVAVAAWDDSKCLAGDQHLGVRPPVLPTPDGPGTRASDRNLDTYMPWPLPPRRPGLQVAWRTRPCECRLR
jgi:hypothetical protein